MTARAIAEYLGRRLDLPVVSLSPEEAPAHFGFLGHFITLDSPTASTKTRECLGWEPTGPPLIEDLEHLVLPDRDHGASQSRGYWLSLIASSTACSQLIARPS